MKKQQRKNDERVGFPDISDTISLVVVSLLFFHYSMSLNLSKLDYILFSVLFRIVDFYLYVVIVFCVIRPYTRLGKPK